jgi:hypothetical protein
MTPSLRNPVLAVADQDYQPALVRVDEEAIGQLSVPQGLESMGVTLPVGLISEDLAAFVPYFVAMNTLNYQFWELDTNGQLQRYSHGGKVGALAMQDCFYAAWLNAWLEVAPAAASVEEHVRLTATSLRTRIAQDGVTGIFGNIPESESRQRLLLEVLDAPKLSGAAEYLVNRIRKTSRLGWEDATLLAQVFPQGYGDRYLKKAQLTLMFIVGQLNGLTRTQCQLDVTAAADYQLPKVLRVLGVLRYGKALAERVDQQQPILADSSEERAIRAATVKACERLAAQFGCSLPEVDFWLWLNRNQARDAQFHLTGTTAY